MVINDNYFFKDKNLTNFLKKLSKNMLHAPFCQISSHLLIVLMLYPICTQEKTPKAEEKSKQSVENLVARRGHNKAADKLRHGYRDAQILRRLQPKRSPSTFNLFTFKLIIVTIFFFFSFLFLGQRSKQTHKQWISFFATFSYLEKVLCPLPHVISKNWCVEGFALML